ncbi:unnamed protein product, partial [Heterosigma akashiwo]
QLLGQPAVEGGKGQVQGFPGPLGRRVQRVLLPLGLVLHRAHHLLGHFPRGVPPLPLAFVHHGHAEEVKRDLQILHWVPDEVFHEEDVELALGEALEPDLELQRVDAFHHVVEVRAPGIKVRRRAHVLQRQAHGAALLGLAVEAVERGGQHAEPVPDALHPGPGLLPAAALHLEGPAGEGPADGLAEHDQEAAGLGGVRVPHLGVLALGQGQVARRVRVEERVRLVEVGQGEGAFVIRGTVGVQALGV